MSATLTLHVLPPSHPCRTVEAALRVKGLDAEIVTLTAGEHNAVMEEIYGAGNRTVPGLLVDGEPVHGSVAILERLEELAPEPALYPEAIADAVREAERWGDAELQDLGRPGYAAAGVSASGAADALGLRIGNRLVGNLR